MKIKRVLYDPSPLLRAPNSEVTEPWEYIQENVKRMFKVMYDAPGVGLAAPQVGWNVRLFVMDPDTKAHKPENRRIFWNPKILVSKGDRKLLKEGCLSLPGVFGMILRFHEVRLQAETPRGTVVEEFDGYAAQIVQHEVDHLNGIMCFDNYVPPLLNRGGVLRAQGL